MNLKKLQIAAEVLRARRADRVRLVANDERIRAELAELDTAEQDLAALLEQRSQHLAETALARKAPKTTDIDARISAAREAVQSAVDKKIGLQRASELLETQLAACDDDINAAQNDFNDSAGDVCLNAYAEAKRAFEGARAEIRRAVIAMAAANEAGSRFGGAAQRDEFDGVVGLVDSLFPYDQWLTVIDDLAKPGVASLLETIEATH